MANISEEDKQREQKRNMKKEEKRKKHFPKISNTGFVNAFACIVMNVNIFSIKDT